MLRLAPKHPTCASKSQLLFLSRQLQAARHVPPPRLAPCLHTRSQHLGCPKSPCRGRPWRCHQGHQEPDGTACPPWDARAASVPSPVPCRAGFVHTCVTLCLSFPPPWIRCPLGALVFVCVSVGLPCASPGLATRSPGISGAPRRCDTLAVTATSTRSRGCCRP